MVTIKTLDLAFQGMTEVIGAFIVKTDDGPILFETGPSSTLDNLKKELRKNKIFVEDIQHVFVTHVHLDHSGAAWYFAKKGAKIYVHEDGAKHLIDPTNLKKSAEKIYGDQMDKLWGDINPVPAESVIGVKNGQEFEIGQYTIKAIFTPGHATHHVGWRLNNILFAGDCVGVRIDDGPVIPPCPPPDVDLDAWVKTLQHLDDVSIKVLYMSHFGKSRSVKIQLFELKNRIIKWEKWMTEKMEAKLSREEIIPQFEAFVREDLVDGGVSPTILDRYEKACPAWMSVDGLMRYISKKGN